MNFLSKGKNFFRNYRLVNTLINFAIVQNLAYVDNISQNVADICFGEIFACSKNSMSW